MGRMYDAFDGSQPELIEAERKLFEADAEPYGFDFTRHTCAAPEPWGEYLDAETGHRWGGWLAARSCSGLATESVKRLIEIVRADEREACAVVAEQGEWKLTKIGKAIAAAIRRRSNT